MDFKDGFERRFWSKIEKSGPHDCWLWTAKAKHRFGYGVVNVNGGAITAHRVAYMLSHGPIPVGAHVLHKCDVPGCCNPDHLYLGDAAQNVADMISRKRRRIWRHSAETIEKIKAGRAANPPKLTDEGRKSRSTASKPLWADPEFRKRFSERMAGANNPMFGKKPSAERMAAVIRANQARKGTFKHSALTRERMRAAALKREERKRGKAHGNDEDIEGRT